MWLTGPAAPWHVGSSQTRARTRVPCISRQILNHCATREAPPLSFKSRKGERSLPLWSKAPEVVAATALLWCPQWAYHLGQCHWRHCDRKGWQGSLGTAAGDCSPARRGCVISPIVTSRPFSQGACQELLLAGQRRGLITKTANRQRLLGAFASRLQQALTQSLHQVSE